MKTVDPEHYTLQRMIIAESDLGGKCYVKPLMINHKPHYTVYFSDYTSYSRARWDIERFATTSASV
ncbi:MAG: hypothetical protein H7829_12015 [Magnetococcus sp. THC-1_WYH]